MNTKVFTIVILLTAGIFTSVQAKIWRINNTPGVNADFTQMHAAAASANVMPGDTLYVEPSAIQYENSNIYKRLIIIGSGYFRNENPGLQENTNTSKANSIYLHEGAQGTHIYGMDITSITFYQTAQPSNYRIEKCHLRSGISANGTHNNMIFKKNIISVINNFITFDLTANNLLFENNIVTHNNWGALSITGPNGNGNIIRNNIFGNPVTLLNAYVYNNIFNAAGNTAQNTLTGSILKNNLFANNQTLPQTAMNNLLNINMSTVFMGNTGGNSLDAQYQLKPGSPAIGAGLTAGDVINPDCGAYGGLDPYVIAGIPSIPTIYEFDMPVSIETGTNAMSITISTRDNN